MIKLGFRQILGYHFDCINKLIAYFIFVVKYEKIVRIDRSMDEIDEVVRDDAITYIDIFD